MNPNPARPPLQLLLLQLLPILVFLLVDALVDDPFYAIAAALGFVVLQAVTTFVRRKKIDAFILIDFLLIGGMGAVSLATHDELFFKLKPAILEGIMVPYLGFLALARERTLSAYFERYGAGMTVPANALGLMRKLLLWLAAGVLLHAILVVVAGLLWSRQVWGWISGPGFYVLLVPFAVWVLIRRIRMKRPPKRLRRAPTPPPSPPTG